MTSPSVEAAEETAVLQFEAVGFVDTRSNLNALERRKKPSPEAMFAQVKDLLAPLGFTGVEAVALNEDDAQGSSDIKVFAAVSLQMHAQRAYSIARDLGVIGLPPPLEQALGRLAAHVCTSKSGHICVDAENWQLANGWEIEHLARTAAETNRARVRDRS